MCRNPGINRPGSRWLGACGPGGNKHEVEGKHVPAAAIGAGGGSAAAGAGGAARPAVRTVQPRSAVTMSTPRGTALGKGPAAPSQVWCEQARRRCRRLEMQNVERAGGQHAHWKVNGAWQRAGPTTRLGRQAGPCHPSEGGPGAPDAEWAYSTQLPLCFAAAPAWFRSSRGSPPGGGTSPAPQHPVALYPGAPHRQFSLQ